MILVDSSVWVDHFRRKDAALSALLAQGLAMSHPFIMGELALGNLNPRLRILELMSSLPQASIAAEELILAFIERHVLHGVGIGYIDAHLLVAASLARAQLWTRDKKLHAVAVRLGLAA